MACYYIEAYDGNGRSILGNLDGQGVITARRYERTKRYKALRQGFPARPRWSKVKYWKVLYLTSDKCREVAHIDNKHYAGGDQRNA